MTTQYHYNYYNENIDQADGDSKAIINYADNAELSYTDDKVTNITNYLDGDAADEAARANEVIGSLAKTREAYFANQSMFMEHIEEDAEKLKDRAVFDMSGLNALIKYIPWFVVGVGVIYMMKKD